MTAAPQASMEAIFRRIARETKLDDRHRQTMAAIDVQASQSRPWEMKNHLGYLGELSTVVDGINYGHLSPAEEITLCYLLIRRFAWLRHQHLQNKSGRRPNAVGAMIPPVTAERLAVWIRSELMRLRDAQESSDRGADLMVALSNQRFAAE